jgi:hypothetical protein
MSIDSNICPFCKFENDQLAKTCTRCGAAIDPQSKTLEIVPTNKTPMPAGLVKDSEMVRGMLVLYALNRHEPILVTPQPEISIGRQGQGQPPLTVDLTAYDAVNLGISRRHALIRCIDGVYTVEDLESANGTWLNDARIKPGVQHILQSTDHLRLGNLKLLIYFNTVGVAQKAAEKIANPVVILKSLFSTELTPAYLVETLTPYCRAVDDLQKLYDEIMHHIPQPIVILQIKGGPVIELHLTGASAIERFIKYRKLQPAAVPALSGSAGAVRTGGVLNKDAVETQMLGERLREAGSGSHSAVAMGWLREIQPGLPDAEMKDYSQRLLPILERIFAGQIEIEA